LGLRVHHTNRALPEHAASSSASRQVSAPGRVAGLRHADPADELPASPAALRLANIVRAAALAPDDVTTLIKWGECVGLSQAALTSRCRASRVRPKNALDFARLLRAILRCGDGDWNPQHYLDILDDRTLGRLFSRAGLNEYWHAPRPPSVAEFLGRQHLIVDSVALTEIRRVLEKPDSRV